MGRPANAAARHAACLFAVSGLLAVMAQSIPGGNRLALAGVAIADLAAAALAWCLPWDCWGPSSTLALCLPALGIMAASNAAGLVPIRAYGVFFTLLFVWVGAHHTPGTVYRLLPLAVVGYCVPILVAPSGVPLDPRAVALVIVVSVLIAETIARTVATASRAQARADRAAQTFHVTGSAISAMRQPNPGAVLDASVEGVMALGYEGAHIALMQPGEGSFRLIHPRGLACSFPTRALPSDAGLIGQVRAAGAPVVIEDYRKVPWALSSITDAGVVTCVGVPVFTDGTLRAVLVASTTELRAIQAEDLEALKLLAEASGVALGAAQQYQAQAALAGASARDALTDELTGLGNRRRSRQILDDLAVGDCLVLVDLDRFKAVNDSLGHAAGDRVLAQVADYLSSHLRQPDAVVRHGGEEFLIHLPQTTPKQGAEVMRRLMVGWRQSRPAITFSAGLACHRLGDSAGTTLDRADQALYRAKDLGRDQLCLADELAPSPPMAAGTSV
ncbi:MAG TPA: sensor domain-containing diguanylate cyclase [Acidimicrobiales bacterium]|nr:sensor domain-containing diguanylate cyclase [Acidimicrobiales bacterium]